MPADRRSRPRALVISADAVGAEMAGVGIRAYEFARALAPHADVTLAAIEVKGALPDPDIPVVLFRNQDPAALRPHVMAADVIVAQPHFPTLMSWMHRSGARLVFDCYVPELLEILESFTGQRGPYRELISGLITDRLLSAFHIGHHFMCASDKQRDLWIGAMLAERLIGFPLYERDPTLEDVIAKVPFGVPPEPPVRVPGQSARDRFPAIGPDDEVVLWNGGLWGWLDAPMAVRAVGLLAERRPGVRLVFMGHALHRPAQEATRVTRALAAELGLLDRVVFFNDRWVPYGERGSWLLDADCALSCHVEHLETRFAFRTRLLDCFWSGLPIVCTRGDDLAGRVERERLGAAIPPGDAAAAAAALESVLARGRAAYAPALARAAAEHAWPAVTEPLVRWVTGAELPPRLGDGLPRRAALRPTQRARALGYRVARGGLNAVGLREWPRQGTTT